MGNGPKQKKPGARSKIKKYKRACYTKNRSKDLDQIQDEVAKAKDVGADLNKVPFDDDLPGGGQFYAFETNRHFIDAKALADHKKTREYKRRVKQLKEEKYDPDWAAGLVREKLPPAHPVKK